MSDDDPLGHLAPFAGRWVGGGDGHYPTIDDFTYDETIELSPMPAKPFLMYVSRTKHRVEGRPLHTENGYLRRSGDDVELLVSQPTGFVEIQRSRLTHGVLDFVTVTLQRSADAKPVHEVKRRWVLDGGTLVYDLWMAHADTPLTHHLHAELRREG
ncbi:MAG: FABP family protein [Rhodococcus sp.]|uniref:FABP family protein n=1 Tax=Rhodococcus TaxID=1827 RepID=UPI0016BAF5E7|nr:MULTISPECIES: FABP family protein [Rhodococcus]NLV78930.1 FABP family protein [Rhodococcus sp. (in: high G+C Gram-positive bacteria)]